LPEEVLVAEGKLRNIGSRGQGALAHSTAKAAVISMTRQLAVEGAEHRIRTNSIFPGFIRSAQTEPFINDPQVMEVIAKSFLAPAPGSRLHPARSTWLRTRAATLPAATY